MTESERYSRSWREARYQGAWAFVDGKRFNRYHIIADGDTLFSYGCHFPMATRLNARNVWVNGERYSVTTSKHQGAVRTVLGIAGYEPTNLDSEFNGHKGYIWRLEERQS